MVDVTLARQFSNSESVEFSNLNGAPCQERSLASNSDLESSVIVLEDAGLQHVHHFASSISAVEGFSGPSNAIFGGDDQD